MEIKYLSLNKNQINQVRDIDRSETVLEVYRLKNRILIKEESPYKLSFGWNAGGLESSIKHLKDIYDNSGFLLGAFDNEKLIGIVALDTRLIGQNKNQMQFYFLHVSSSYRGSGIGKKLFNFAKTKAVELGASRLYVSSNESVNTVDFYMRQGCRLANQDEIIGELKELEPNDIPLILDLNPTSIK